MYRSSIGQVCPPEASRPPRRDPCSIKYIVDLPVLGEEEVEVPVKQLTEDFMSTLRPQINEVKSELIVDAKELIRDTLENTLRPEIESQKVELLSDINREANKALVTLSVIAFTIVGAVGLAAWYTLKRTRA